VQEVGTEDFVLAGEGLTVRVYRGQERLEDSSACGDLESATLQRAVCEYSNCDPRTAHDLHAHISLVHAPTRQARLGLCASMVMEKGLRAGLRVSQWTSAGSVMPLPVMRIFMGVQDTVVMSYAGGRVQ
jgi:hypothetical protein